MRVADRLLCSRYNCADAWTIQTRPDIPQIVGGHVARKESFYVIMPINVDDVTDSSEAAHEKRTKTPTTFFVTV
jgi:hypothetical protein